MINVDLKKYSLPALLEKLNSSFTTIEDYCVAFGFFGLINYSSLYSFDAQYPNELILQTWIGLILSSLLMLADYVPKRFHQIKKLFWCACLFYTLAFFTVSQIIFTYASAQSLLNAILSVFLLIVITDWLVVIFFLVIATLFAYLYMFIDHWGAVSWGFYLRGFILLEKHYYMTFYFVWALFIATLFLRKIDKKKENYLLKRQLKVTQIIASSIAHELRTPLLTISATIEGLKRFTPTLIDAYQQAKEHHLPVKKIPDDFYQALKQSMDRASNEVIITNTIINILLIRLRGRYQDKNKIEIFNISKPILLAIKRYPFDLESQRQLIHVDLNQDFACKAISLLIVHVFFNLLKNALYQIRKTKKGDINIWLEQLENTNIVYFKDTSSGINKKYLPHLFDEFFSMTTNGTGVGLTFCQLVMRELGGNIKVKSKEGEFTTFALSFPKLNSLTNLNMHEDDHV